MRWISPPTKLEVAKLRLESASMLRSMRRFSSSYKAMTMSMATNAEGTAAMDIHAVCWLCAAGWKNRKSDSLKMAQQVKEIASSWSASVSWRRLSCQKMMATARKRNAHGATTGMEKKCRELPVVHKPRTTALIPAARIHGLRWAYNCAPRKNQMETRA